MAAPGQRNRPRTFVYIDGFNLYNRAFRYHPDATRRALKWVDVLALARHVLTDNDVAQVRYFTARILPTSRDVDAPVRQDTYLRALATVPDLSIHFGQFKAREKPGPVVSPLHLAGLSVKISTFEEKGSDVNMAVWAMRDAYEERPEVSVFLTGDSDLAEPARLLKPLGISVGVILPAKVANRDAAGRPIPNRRPNKIPADFVKTLRRSDLAASQLPDIVADGRGHQIHRPRAWR